MKRNVLLAVASAVLIAGSNAALAQEYSVGNLTMRDLWTVTTPETAKDAPGYLTITNNGSAPDRLIGGSFANSQHVETHSMAGSGAKKKMERSDGIVVNPGETITLKPGGDHLMFVQLRSGLKPGETEQAVLQFEKAGAKTVEFEVRGTPAGSKSAAKRLQTN